MGWTGGASGWMQWGPGQEGAGTGRAATEGVLPGGEQSPRWVGSHPFGVPPPPPPPAAGFVVLEALRPAGALLWDCPTSVRCLVRAFPHQAKPSALRITDYRALSSLSAGTTPFVPTSALPRPFPGATWRGLEKLRAEFPQQGCPLERRVSGWVGRRPGTRLLPHLRGSEEVRRDKGSGEDPRNSGSDPSPGGALGPLPRATRATAASTPGSEPGAWTWAPPVPGLRAALLISAARGGSDPRGPAPGSAQLPPQRRLKGSRRAALPGARGFGVRRSLLHRPAPAQPGFLFNNTAREAPAESARQNFLPG
uniref:Uncharacterized protein LOC112815675 n=1 Tax=Callorhinus ursinus TaxID=34884 RepID=A0A3Q7PNF9_CALUR|nr:uncharacterized protein LOC112815675 [Callorhinus ursinus]